MTYKEIARQHNAKLTALREKNTALQATVAARDTTILTLEESIASLVGVPVPGEAWDIRKNYTTGDTVTHGGTDYTALRAGRGKPPDTSPEHWEVTVAEAPVTPWEDDASGEAYSVGDKRTHNGSTWVCIKAHTKSQVRVPLVGSQWWEVAA